MIKVDYIKLVSLHDLLALSIIILVSPLHISLTINTHFLDYNM